MRSIACPPRKSDDPSLHCCILLDVTDAAPADLSDPDSDQDGERRDAAKGTSSAPLDPKPKPAAPKPSAAAKADAKRAVVPTAVSARSHPVDFYDKDVPALEPDSVLERVLRGEGAAGAGARVASVPRGPTRPSSEDPSEAGAPTCGGGRSAREAVAQLALDLICRALAQRPVWHPVTLWRHVAGPTGPGEGEQGAAAGPQLTGPAFEKAVQQVTYRFKNGPWRGMVVRLGYDPRKDFESRWFQGVDVFLPMDYHETRAARAQNAEVEVEALPGTLHAGAGAGAGESAVGAPPGTEAVPVGALGPRGGRAHKQVAEPQWGEVLQLKALPAGRHVTLQFQDIEDEEVRSLLSSAAPTVLPTLDHGWLQEMLHDVVAAAIRGKLAALLRADGYEAATAALLAAEGRKAWAAGQRKKRAAEEGAGTAGAAKKKTKVAAAMAQGVVEAAADALLGPGAGGRGGAAGGAARVVSDAVAAREARRGMEDAQGWVNEDELVYGGEGGGDLDRDDGFDD